MWGEAAGDKQVMKERDAMWSYFAIDRMGWLASCSDDHSTGWCSVLLRELGGFHITARPHVARAYEPTTQSPSSRTTQLSWSRHTH